MAVFLSSLKKYRSIPSASASGWNWVPTISFAEPDGHHGSFERDMRTYFFKTKQFGPHIVEHKLIGLGNLKIPRIDDPEGVAQVYLSADLFFLMKFYKPEMCRMTFFSSYSHQRVASECRPFEMNDRSGINAFWYGSGV
jgi:hypothetical protein